MLRILKTIYRDLKRLQRKIKFEKLYRLQKWNLEQVISNDKRKLLIITNDNNGGTEQFLDDYLSKMKELCPILIVRHSYGERKDIIYEVRNYFTSCSVLLHLNEMNQIWNYSFDSIIVNTLVHFSRYEYFLDKCIQYKKVHPNCSLIYFIHDFNSICPKCNLVNNNHYCHLDCTKEKCRLYLADSLIDIGEWRKHWNEFLCCCNEIRCFSESSKDLILKAYPNIDSSRLSVRPHDISYINYSEIYNLEFLKIHLGVVGSCISTAKGKKIVKKMILQYGDDIPITLVGSGYKAYRIKKKKTSYLGPYNHDDLQRIIEEQKISCVLFPSIWPETFSYLVSELMTMNLPIICFNLGAQGEKCSNYKKGIVIDNEDQLWDVIDQMRNAGTWAEYVKRHPNFHNSYALANK